MTRAAAIVEVLCTVLVGLWILPAAGAPQEARNAWLQSFKLAPADAATVGENRYFILRPGYGLTLDGKEGGRAVRLIVTVLDETKDVGGFETRVVEERETQGGALAEVSRNYFAIDTRTHDIYYFGEDVDTYKDGRVLNHEGAWLHGSGQARFGLMMPGSPTVGLRYYQELAPAVAMDRARILSLSERLTTPAGTFENCLKTEETTPLEPGTRELKLYAPGVGLVQDGTLVLTAIRKHASPDPGAHSLEWTKR